MAKQETTNAVVVAFLSAADEATAALMEEMKETVKEKGIAYDPALARYEATLILVKLLLVSFFGDMGKTLKELPDDHFLHDFEGGAAVGVGALLVRIGEKATTGSLEEVYAQLTNSGKQRKLLCKAAMTSALVLAQQEYAVEEKSLRNLPTAGSA